MKLIAKIFFSLLICLIFTEKVKGDLSNSLADFDKAVKLKPNSADACIARGEAKYKLNDPISALADYKKAVELRPDLLRSPDMAQSNQDTFTNEIQLQVLDLFKAKDFENLDKLAAKYRTSKEREANGMWKLAYFYDAFAPSNHATDDDWDARLDTISRWSVARPESITAQVAWASVLVDYAWNGDSDTNAMKTAAWQLYVKKLTLAAQILKQARSLKEQCPMLYRTVLKSATVLHAHRFQFESIFEQAIKSEPDCESYYFYRAIYLLPQWCGTNGEWQCDLANSADKVGGQNGDMLYAQVVWNMHRNLKDNPFVADNVSWARVAKGFEFIEQRFPDSLGAKIELAKLAILANEVRANVFYKSGREKQNKGDWDGAIIDFSKAIEIKTNYVFAYVHRGIVKRHKGDSKGAMADYDKAIEISPDYFPAFYNRGVTKQADGDLDGAAADFTKTIELRPDYAPAYTARSSIRQFKGDNGGAKADFQQASKYQNPGK